MSSLVRHQGACLDTYCTRATAASSPQQVHSSPCPVLALLNSAPRLDQDQPPLQGCLFRPSPLQSLSACATPIWLFAEPTVMMSQKLLQKLLASDRCETIKSTTGSPRSRLILNGKWNIAEQYRPCSQELSTRFYVTALSS